MKKITGAIIAIITLVLCFTLSACGYVSHYSATLMVKSNTANKASLSFNGFNGTYVMQLKNNNGEEVFIAYEATLEEGSVRVYYDFQDDKLNLFEIGADGFAEGETETFTGNRTIYVIIESDGNCGNGSFSFVLEKAEI